MTEGNKKKLQTLLKNANVNVPEGKAYPVFEKMLAVPELNEKVTRMINACNVASNKQVAAYEAQAKAYEAYAEIVFLLAESQAIEEGIQKIDTDEWKIAENVRDWASTERYKASNVRENISMLRDLGSTEQHKALFVETLVLYAQAMMVEFARELASEALENASHVSKTSDLFRDIVFESERDRMAVKNFFDTHEAAEMAYKELAKAFDDAAGELERF